MGLVASGGLLLIYFIILMLSMLLLASYKLLDYYINIYTLHTYIHIDRYERTVLQGQHQHLAISTDVIRRMKTSMLAPILVHTLILPITLILVYILLMCQ